MSKVFNRIYFWEELCDVERDTFEAVKELCIKEGASAQIVITPLKENDLPIDLDELEYLRHFHAEVDFGPAHDDVVGEINNSYGKPLPEGY
jgi:hypothetical protein